MGVIMISCGCVYKRSSKPIMKGSGGRNRCSGKRRIWRIIERGLEENFDIKELLLMGILMSFGKIHQIYLLGYVLQY